MAALTPGPVESCIQCGGGGESSLTSIMLSPSALSRLAPLALPALLAGLFRAQDPPPPPGGFPVLEQLDQLLTYADGYRTRYDLRLPDPAQIAPPAGGWPCIALVHGFSGARSLFALTGEGRRHAERGYITVAYDVRGQGQARGLNPNRGTLVTGAFERADLAELFHQIEARLGSVMDFGRLVVMGTSQGGDHAWAAAAMSGRLMPQPRGSITTFPVIAAVCPRAGSPDLAEVWNPDGAAFAGNFTRGWFQSNAIYEPSFQAQLQQQFLAQDFAGLANLMRNDPWRQDVALLPQSRVPVFVNYSWDDAFVPENIALDGLALLPPSTPRLAYLSTGIHGTATNQLEAATTDRLTERWLDRMVKGFADEIDRQPPYRAAVIPANPAAAVAANSVWQLRDMDAFPGTGVAPTVLYLRAGGRLLATPPAAAEAPDRVRHQVAAGFDPQAWVQTSNQTAAVFGGVPFDSVSYRGDPLPAPVELLGRGRIRLHVTSNAANLQLHVALFDETPAGERRYITGGYRCIRGRAPGTAAYDLETRGTAYVIPAGHRWVVAVENHTWHRPVGIDELRTVPYFESYVFDCEHTNLLPSSVALPLTAPRLGARSASVALSAAAGGTIDVPLDGSVSRAADPYVVLVGLSGTVPGFGFAGQSVPLNVDALTQLALTAPTTPPFAGFVGVLDGAGRATARLAAAPGLLVPVAGGRLSFCAGVFGGSGLALSAASQVDVTP